MLNKKITEITLNIKSHMKCIKMKKYVPCQSKNKETGIIILKSQKNRIQDQEHS